MQCYCGGYRRHTVLTLLMDAVSRYLYKEKIVLGLLKLFSKICTSNADGFSVIFLVMCEMSLYLTDSSCSSVTISVALYHGRHEDVL